MAKAKKLPSGKWRVLVYAGKNKNGKRTYKSFTAPTQRKAEKAALEWQENYQLINFDLTNLTVRLAIDRYIEQKSNVLSPSTIAGYRRIQRNCLQELMDIRLNRLTPDDVQNAVNRMAAIASPKYVRNAYGLITAVLHDLLPAFPTRITLPPPRPQILIPAEDYTTEIFAAVKGTEIELPVLLAAWLSLRMSEVRGIRWTAINGDVLTIDTAIVDCEGHAVEKGTKNISSTRKLRVPPYIMELIRKQPHTSEFVITLSGQAIYKRFVRTCEKAGLPHFRFHDLRHINASVMLALGVPDKYAMERGGWKTDRTLKKVYQHTWINQREDIDNRINGYFSQIMQHEMQHKNISKKSLQSRTIQEM